MPFCYLFLGTRVWTRMWEGTKWALFQFCVPWCICSGLTKMPNWMFWGRYLPGHAHPHTHAQLYQAFEKACNYYISDGRQTRGAVQPSLVPLQSCWDTADTQNHKLNKWEKKVVFCLIGSFKNLLKPRDPLKVKVPGQNYFKNSKVVLVYLWPQMKKTKQY